MDQLPDDARAAVVAAGLLPRHIGPDLSAEEVESVLRRRFDRSSWWQPGDLPPDRGGPDAMGHPLPVWAQPSVDPLPIDALSRAVDAARPESTGHDEFLRVRVETDDDARALWELDRFGSVTVAPSFASRGSLTKTLTWRWPLRVGVVGSAASTGWIDDVQASYHHGVVYDAEVLVAGGDYEIAIVHVSDLDAIPPAAGLGRCACVIAVGDDGGIDLMGTVDRIVGPTIAIGIAAPPAAWWMPLLEEMTHDRPIDVAVARIRQMLAIDAAIAGPAVGLDVTAPGRWFSVVAPDHPLMSERVAELPHWDWSSEGGGASNLRHVVDLVRNEGGHPRAEIPPGAGRPLGSPSTSSPPPPPVPAGAPPPPESTGPVPAGAEPGQEVPEEAAPGGDGAEPSGARTGRFAHAVVVDDDGDRLTLIADRTNRLRCWIGPDRGEFAAVADVAAPELDRDVLLKVDLVVGRSVVASGTIFLPLGETVRSSDCELAVPPMPEGVFAAELAFTLDGRMFELVAVTGLVVAAGTDDGSAHPLRVTSLVDHREILQFSQRSESSASLDVTSHDGVIVVREFGPRSSGVYDLTSRPTLVATLMRQLYATEKSLVRRDRHGQGPDPEWTELLRTMATHGWLLHQALTEQGFTDPGSRLEVVNRLPDAYVPVELIYDRGAPADDAEVDQVCLDALARGDDDCGHCHPFAELTDAERDRNARICPYGFWSLGKIIERHDADTDGFVPSPVSTDAVHRLQRLGSILTGWSTNIRPDDQEHLRTHLTSSGRTVHVAADWDAWQGLLGESPTILLALPHHDEADGIGSLEIGGTKLGRQRALDLIVRTPAGEPGPVLILLGCETDAGNALGHPSFARAFAAHTSVVIGTLSKVLGRHAVPFAERLVEALVAAQGTGGDVGTVLRDVRRAMFADGYLMALGVIALGDADWQLAEGAVS